MAYNRSALDFDPILLRLSNSIITALQKADYCCVEDFFGMDKNDLNQISGIGKKRRRKIIDLLYQLPFDFTDPSLPQNPEQDPFAGVTPNLKAFIQEIRYYNNDVADRGLKYFRDNRVQDIQLVDVRNKKYTAIVRGSRSYNAELVLGAEDQIGVSCSCPYFAGSSYYYVNNCKHIYAFIFALAEKQRLERFQGDASKRYSFNHLVGNLKSVVNETKTKDGELEYYMVRYKNSWTLYPKKIYPELSALENQTSRYGYSNYYGLSYDDPWKKLNPSLPEDRLAITYLQQMLSSGQNRYGGPGQSATLPDYSIGDVLDLIKDRTIYLREGKQTHHLPVQHEPLHVTAEFKGSNGIQSETDVDKNQENLLFEFYLKNEDQTFRLNELEVITANPCWVFFDGKLARVEGSPEACSFFLKAGQKVNQIPQKEIGAFFKEVHPMLSKANVPVEMPEDFVQERSVDPVPRLYLKEKGRQLYISLNVAYGEVEIDSENQPDTVIVPSEEDRETERPYMWSVKRDLEKENKWVSLLEETGLIPGQSYRTFIPKDDPLQWVAEQLPGLTEKGFEVYGENNLKRFARPKKITGSSFTVSSGENWFELEGDVTFEDVSISLGDLLEAVDDGGGYFKLNDDTNGTLSEDWLKRLKKMMYLMEPGEKKSKVPQIAAPLIDELAAETGAFQSDKSFDVYAQKFRDFEDIEQVDVPASFKGELRNYQEAGLSWLWFLHRFDMGGILADDMGLGKTIQVLALLAKIYEEEDKPHCLIIAPRSVIHNWQAEAKRFVPDLETYVHHGTDRISDMNEWPEAELNITTYSTMRNDVEFLKNNKFDYIILDESHAVRNPASKTFRALRTLKAHHRLCMTGTPVQNTTMDLWAQMEFLNPGFLGSQKKFKSKWVQPIEKKQDEEAERLLHKMTSPFILRRTKQKVADDLPPLTNSRIDCDLEGAQQRTYEKYRRKYYDKIHNSINEKGVQKSRFTVLEGLTRLRQICCSPELLKKEKGSSAKLNRFTELAEELIQEGHRALIFSQFVGFLKMIEETVQKKGWEYEYLDGSTTNRQERVDEFQKNADKKLFLISLKAGGEGLNLTGADYVFLMDPWWNPAAERQAMDRTHRIGQNQHVFVYRFVTPGTVEEKILRLQDKKRGLAEKLVVAESGIFKEMERDDLLALFEE